MDKSVTYWISQLARDDREPAEQLWKHFSGRMQNLARRQLDPQTRRTYDEQDAANSAFHSLCQGINDGRFEQVTDRDSMWGLLAIITARKVSKQQRSENRQKRGSGQVRGDSVFAEFGINGLDAVEGTEPTPELTAMFKETCGRLIESLGDPMLENIVRLKFEGYRNTEVAKRVGRTRRTIERKLEQIRRIWVGADIIFTNAVEESVDTQSADHQELLSDSSKVVSGTGLG